MVTFCCLRLWRSGKLTRKCCRACAFDYCRSGGYNSCVSEAAASTHFDRNNDIAWLAASIIVLAVSFALTPSPTGYGTHTKLFLPPCTFRAVTHIPCPFCGLTTSFCHISRLHVASAFRSNVMGPPAYLLVLLQIPYRIYSLARKRPPLQLWHGSAWLNRGLAAFIVVAWAVNIYIAVG